jgi:ribosomal peptide maturation radical SAM protein 1
LKIVIGGSVLAGESLHDLFRVFPEIDFAVNGEGEIPLGRLVDELKTGDPRPIPGVVSRSAKQAPAPIEHSQLPDLGRLPPPDYADYFRLLASFSPERRFFPTLPAEMSRGCWWQRVETQDKPAGCAFCNLNLQWEGYRTKNVEQIISEVDYLTDRYRLLSIAFMDNLLPVRTSGEIFSALAKLEKDLDLFGEIRADTPLKVLASMRDGGLKEVQIGIEALSTQLLKKLNKGVTAIQNLEIMKHCEALGIVNVSNLILHFPGSDAEDVSETMDSLAYAQPFRPLKLVNFWLGQGSPVWQHPREFGLQAVFNHPNYVRLFPPEIAGAVRFMIQSYRGDIGLQRKLWRPVQEVVQNWKKAYEALHSGSFGEPILSFRDGRDFLIIRQRRPTAGPVTHRLLGTSRKIYLFCHTRRSLSRVLAQFRGLSAEKLLPFLKMMVEKKLMFAEGRHYLSLAVPAVSEQKRS